MRSSCMVRQTDTTTLGGGQALAACGGLINVGALQTPGYAQSVEVVGGLAYVAASSSGLRIIDVSNSAAPVELGSLVTSLASDGLMTDRDAAVGALGRVRRACERSLERLQADPGAKPA